MIKMSEKGVWKICFLTKYITSKNTFYLIATPHGIFSSNWALWLVLFIYAVLPASVPSWLYRKAWINWERIEIEANLTQTVTRGRHNFWPKVIHMNANTLIDCMANIISAVISEMRKITNLVMLTFDTELLTVCHIKMERLYNRETGLSGVHLEQQVVKYSL